MDNVKQLGQLINSHKLSSILMPLVEVCEINRRQQSMPDVTLQSLTDEVLNSSRLLMQSLSNEDGAVFDDEEMSNHLLLSMSKALGNSAILYNQVSLSLFSDEIIKLITVNKSHFQDVLKIVERRGEVDTKESQSYVAACLVECMLPILLFNTNLFLSGIIKGHDGLSRVNEKSSKFMVELLLKISLKLSDGQGDYSGSFRESNISMISKVCSHVVRDFQGKLIKNKDSLMGYIDSPATLLGKLVPAIVENINAMNYVIQGVMDKEAKAS